MRTVWVMPVPLARCAFSRSRCGTSIVILRTVLMKWHYTILRTSLEDGLFRESVNLFFGRGGLNGRDLAGGRTRRGC